VLVLDLINEENDTSVRCCKLFLGQSADMVVLTEVGSVNLPLVLDGLDIHLLIQAIDSFLRDPTLNTVTFRLLNYFYVIKEYVANGITMIRLYQIKYTRLPDPTLPWTAARSTSQQGGATTGMLICPGPTKTSTWSCFSWPTPRGGTASHSHICQAYWEHVRVLGDIRAR
jgi:hypothetical protein